HADPHPPRLPADARRRGEIGDAMQTQLLIDGKLTDGQGEPEIVLDPASGNPIARVPEASTAQVAEEVAAPERAFPAWSRTTPKDRSLALLALAEAVESRAAAFAEIESL